MAGERQWLRYFKLYVISSGDGGENRKVLDLSDFRVKFHITQACTARPCTAEISVYNVSEDTINLIDAPTNNYVKDRHIEVVIEAGYQEKHAVIFDGDLWWKSTGRENETDTFMRLIAATGDRAHAYGTVNRTLPAGASQEDVRGVIAASAKEYGVSVDDETTLATTKLPRGKVMYGMLKDAMQGFADTNNLAWGYGSQGITTVPRSGHVPDEDRVIILNPESGLLDRPEVNVAGVKARALLNPDLEFGRVVQIDNSLVQSADYSTEQKSSSISQNQVAQGKKLDSMGLYIVMSREHEGDTRGDEWYTNIVAVGYNPEDKTTSQEILDALPNQR